MVEAEQKAETPVPNSTLPPVLLDRETTIHMLETYRRLYTMLNLHYSCVDPKAVKSVRKQTKESQDVPLRRSSYVCFVCGEQYSEHMCADVSDTGFGEINNFMIHNFRGDVHIWLRVSETPSPVLENRSWQTTGSELLHLPSCSS